MQCGKRANTASAGCAVLPHAETPHRATRFRPRSSVSVPAAAFSAACSALEAFGIANTGVSRAGNSARPGAACALCAPRFSAAPCRRRWRRRKIVVAERRIGDDGDAVPLAPRDHRVLDRALLQMIEHLVAGDLALAGPPAISSRSSASKLLTPQERILPARSSSSKAATVSASG